MNDQRDVKGGLMVDAGTDDDDDDDDDDGGGDVIMDEWEPDITSLSRSLMTPCM